jgi:4-hydroxybenzoate polyprenyltransferase
MQQLIQISRPRFWIYLFGPFVLGVIAGLPSFSQLPEWRVGIWALLFLFPANFMVYAVNDLADWDTDQHNPKKQGYEQGARPEYHATIRTQLIIITILLACAVALSPQLWWLVLGFIVLGLGYSYPPLRFKARPFLDALSNIFYAFPGFLGYILVSGQYPNPWIVFAALCWCAAMHAFSAVPDITADAKADLATVATRLGVRGTTITCMTAYLLAYGITAWQSATLTGWVVLAFLGVGYFLLLVPVVRAGTEEAAFKVYRWFPLVNATSGMILTLWVLTWRLF